MIARARELWQWVQRTRPYRTFSHFTDVGGSVLSAGMSYQALFAVFAALWVGFGIFGIMLSGRVELLNTLIEQLNTFVPGLIGAGEGGLVDVDVLLSASILSWTGVVAAVSLLWVAINWFTGTRRSIRIIFGLDVKQYRNAVLLKLRDFVLAMLFGAAILISAALTVLSSNLVDAIFGVLGWRQDTWLFGTMGTFTRYAAMYVFDVLVLMAMHRFLAEVRVSRLRLIVGCSLGGLALLGLKVLGAALLGGATSNPLLTSFALFIGVLLWFNFICRVLLLTASWIATGLDRTLGLPILLNPAEHY
jgi:membrane protein